MSQIVKYVCEELANAEISCMVVNGDPGFKGVEIASLLGYKKPRNAVYVHVPLKFKNKLSFLLGTVSVPAAGTLSTMDLDASWICEAGLYKLVFKSQLKTAEVFTDWVCEVVLPSIRKTGT